MIQQHKRRLAIIILDVVFRLCGTGIHLILYLLGWRFIYFAGRLTGDIFYLLNSRKRKITEEELALLFSNKFDRRKIRDITRKSFENYYMRQIETIFFGALNKHRINKIMHVEGIENLDNALSKGKGVILLLSHFGSFLLPLPLLGYMGYKVNQVTGRQKHSSIISERIWVWRKNEANKLPVHFIQAGKFLRPLYKALKQNKIVAIAFDGRDGSRWTSTNFFERKAYFSSGPFELARKTDAIIIPTFVVRDKNGFHTVVLYKSFELSNESDIEKALSIDTQRYSDIFAKYIARYPCHFGMILYKYKKMRAAGIGKPLFLEN